MIYNNSGLNLMRDGIMINSDLSINSSSSNFYYTTNFLNKYSQIVLDTRISKSTLVDSIIKIVFVVSTSIPFLFFNLGTLLADALVFIKEKNIEIKVPENEDDPYSELLLIGFGTNEIK
jgi:hypothetical protein